MNNRGLAATLVGGLTASTLSIVLAGSSANAVIDEPLDASGANTIQLIATNDFHGRILEDTTNAGGAAELAGAVKTLRAEQPNTVFAAAGDLIGASTFESFIQKDQPTIDALNAAGLDVSAAGNHEFDQGAADLTDRVIAGGANAKWTYISANVIKHDTGSPLLDPSYVKSFSGINGTGTSTAGCTTATSAYNSAVGATAAPKALVAFYTKQIADATKVLKKLRKKHKKARAKHLAKTVVLLKKRLTKAKAPLAAANAVAAAASTAKTAACKDYRIGFVGAVTEDLPSLVSPAGIAGLDVTAIPAAVNAEAAKLKAAGVDSIVLLVHEGSESTDCATIAADTTSNFGRITSQVSSDVDGIISGHTHLAYNCELTKTTNGSVTGKRFVTSAGQYGTKITQTVLKIGADNKISTATTATIDLTRASTSASQAFTPDADVAALVAAAKTKADELGTVKIGSLEGTFDRAKLGNGSTTVTTTENRGGESTLGNLVAEVQRWATESTESGAAQIAFMNPGGLRADMPGGTTAPVDLTYKQAATVQPFANTLVNLKLTGAQLKTVLEQQWQRDSAGKVASRPFLRLGVSKGFTYTYTQAAGTDSGGTAVQVGTVTGMWLNGVKIDPADTTTKYSVTVNSFLGSGGDNFREFANGTGKKDTGKVDLEAMVDYLEAYATSTALPVDYSQRAVEVSKTVSGDQVTLNIKSWLLAGAAKKDATLDVKAGSTTLGTATLDNTVSSTANDDNGTASITVTVPSGTTELTLVGATTGTSITVPLS
ncbi:MAG: 5'-nucleotidase C-terminal domain-containing protein [Nocardioides sp.]|uniref:bifunctional metallophosphatase/5'-nucleotidase n=1 Tax=Nocardioides sp. TaxID=35761 RepID=UPI0039E3615B